MSKRNELGKRLGTAPGEGERRAQRGYVTQYDLGARLIYDVLAAGRLRWVGLADRNAGVFDDIVLGLHDRIAAYQVKTSRDPEPFTIKTVLLGAPNIWKAMLNNRRKLTAQFPGVLVETIYACDDYPRPNNDLGNAHTSVSSAAYLRAHEANRLRWTLEDWRASPFAGLIGELQEASGLDDDAFLTVWRHTRFIVAGHSRALGLAERTATDSRRLRALAGELPRLVADDSDRDRWQASEILARLGWRDPFGLKHEHAFPVDALYQTNARTEDQLKQVLSAITSGYVSLVGPPGSGKSTLLAAGLLLIPRAIVTRYLAFVPGEGHGLGRAEAPDFLHDMVTQLKQQGLGETVMPGSEPAELQEQFGALLREAGERFRTEGVRTVVVIDGLDHVPREERPRHSFLRELPLPHALPDGVVFVLGTQKLKLQDMPPAVRDQAGEEDRQIVVSPLPREALARLADAAGVPKDVDRGRLYARTDGHPLSARYVIEGLLNAATSEGREEWLASGPAYGGDVEEFYRRAWRDLEHNTEAQRALAYVALAEGPISPTSLDGIVGSSATDAAWDAAGHLLVRDRQRAWSIFHNSFLLFLRVRTGLRHGVADEAMVRKRYGELADMARDVGSCDPQRWMELRYRARAGDHRTVAELATPARFRAQFIEGRDPGNIVDDITFAFAAAGTLRRPELVLDLILSRHEISLRADALGDEMFEALIEIGDRQAARGLLDASGISLTVNKGYQLVDAFLEAGEGTEARKLFHDLEPLDKLLGSARLEGHAGGDDLCGWAERALVFRDPGQLLVSLARLRAPEHTFGTEFDIEAYCSGLKLTMIRGQLGRDPDRDPWPLAEALQLGLEHHGLVRYFAAEAAFQADNDPLATERLEAAVVSTGSLSPDLRREAATMAARLGRLDLAALFLEGTGPPTLAGRDCALTSPEELRRASRQVVIHTALSAWLGRSFEAGRAAEKRLLANYQSHLETIGRLLGDGRAGRAPFTEPLQAFRAVLEFLQHAEGDDRYDFFRSRIDEVMDEAVTAMVQTADALGDSTRTKLIEALDVRLEADPGRLGRPSIRRAHAMAAHYIERDAHRAEWRLGYGTGRARTPAGQVSEAALAASTLAAFGLEEKARALLADMHADGLGLSRPPKKDSQYIFWKELFVLACDEDPAGRPDRLRFLGRLLTGMGETDGDDIAKRLVLTFLGQAAQESPAWAIAAADRIEEVGLVTWPKLVTELVAGVAKKRPDLSVAAAVIFGRVALPFGTEHDGNLYPELISAASADLVGPLVGHAVTCLETDAHPDARILFLEATLDAVAERGHAQDAAALERWRTELPLPRSGSSPEDPFFLARTLDDITQTLERDAESTGRWGAVRAFERIAPRSDYETAKKVFEAWEVLRDDERAIDTIAHAALTAGCRADALAFLARLKRLAEDKGTWGQGWSGKAKQRYHRLNVLLAGDDACAAAFDAFVDDLAGRGGSLGYVLLPELADILGMLSPRPSWAEAWSRLQDHLCHFREHRLGRNLEVQAGVSDGDEYTLADVLFRAIDTTAIALTRMARTAAVELTQVPGGQAVVAALLVRLWQTGGQHALEGVQIAWECRDVAAIRDALVQHLDEMCASDDYAVRRLAVLLACRWGQRPCTKRANLPAVYGLELPPHPQDGRFEPPSGSSLTSSGLYTEDPYSWTWPLQSALGLAADASGIDHANLRARAAQLMARTGGKGAFGPEPQARQERRLGKLRLQTSFRRLPVSAAFRAMREVVGELAAAETIDPRVVPHILLRAGGYAANVGTLAPIPRPLGVPAAEMSDLHTSSDYSEWRGRANQDLVRPKISGHLVLASTAVHKRRHFQEEWVIEQYFGPDIERDADRLHDQLHRLSTVVMSDNLCLLYRGFAPGAVIQPQAVTAGSIDPHTVMLCPRVAGALGWRADPRHALRYFDESGRVADTLYWRDGGAVSREADNGVVRYGHVLVVREDQTENIRPYLAPKQVTRAWRVTRKHGNEQIVVGASRSEYLVGGEPR